MAASRARADPKHARDLVKRQVRSVSQVDDVALTVRKAVDLCPDRDAIFELVSRRHPVGGREPNAERLQAPPKAMLVHGEPIDGPICPRSRIADGGSRPQLIKEPCQDLLNRIIGLVVREPEPADESEQALCICELEVSDQPANIDGRWSRTVIHGCRDLSRGQPP
jgi:hypothetical protein